MPEAFDICVVGAGPVGAALACRLAKAGLAVAVIDRAPLPPMEHPDFDGRAYAIAAGSQRLLDAAGVWNRLPQPPGPIREIRISDGRIGRPAAPLFLHFDYRELAGSAGRELADADAPGSQPFGWMVEARSLRMALNQALAATNGLRVFAPAAATVVRGEAGARVQIAGGPALSCRLVVAAEGRDSPLRREAGIAVTRFPYRQSAIVCAIAHDLPHDGIALEHFLPAGPFAQLPMAGTAGAPNLSALVWTESHRLAARLMALDDATFTREIGRRLGAHLGAFRPIGRRWSYPLAALYAHRMVAQRLALVGDAAHGIHPIAGQGLNLGFRDAAALAALLEDAAPASADPGSPALLARYQRARGPANLAMLAATDTLDRLFSTDLPPIRLARDLGIAAVHRMPRLKRFFMRQAMGG